MASRAWRRGQSRWLVAEPFGGAEELARELRISPLVAQILHNRGIADAAAAKSFLAPKLTDLIDPSALPGATAAAKRIAAAVRGREKIVIYGDYDVDGITATAILHGCLSMVGADVSYYVPHRLEEGYGVNSEAVAKIIADGAKLLITVDCGISAVEQVAQATAGGLDLIVTDHHTCGDMLPAATAIVHPSLPGAQSPNPHLCGAGVAFKLAWQVSREICGQDRVDEKMREFLLNATCLAALGTIADVVPLTGENRVLATYGLRGLPAAKHPGLAAMIESAGLVGEKLDAYHVGFVLAPRLNACGRMGHAGLAVELLTTAPPQRCVEIASYLVQQNTQRQAVEREVAQQAIDMALSMGMDAPACRAVVLASENWHGGVIGIVASRVVERLGRPAILISFNGDGVGHGSGRSIAGFNIRDAMAACGEHLISFGGHAMAGGLRIHRDKIDAFRTALCDYAAKAIPADGLLPGLRIDAESTLGAINHNVVEHLSRLAPFGQGNPSPLLAFGGCELLGPPRRMGKSGQAVSLFLRQNGVSMRAVGFGMGDLADDLAGINRVDIAGEPLVNTFNGSSSVEIRLKDVRW